MLLESRVLSPSATPIGSGLIYLTYFFLAVFLSSEAEGLGPGEPFSVAASGELTGTL